MAASEGKSDSGRSGWTEISYGEIELGDRIGGGGIGVIYHGYYRNEPVALKTLFDPRVSEELKQEYLNELLVMSRVRHSNIVRFIGACMTPPHLFFVMERCAESLYDMLHVHRDQPTPKEIIRMIVRINLCLPPLLLLLTLSHSLSDFAF